MTQNHPDDEMPDPPDELRERGIALWRSVLTDLDLEEHELALLRAACVTADLMQTLAEELVDAPTKTTNARGDEVANPVFVEFRNQSQSLSRLLASLRLPSGLSEGGELQRPQRRGAARGAYGIRGLA